MIIKTQDLDKQEIVKKLRFVSGIISKLIDQTEKGLDWEVTHAQLVVAIAQLKSVTRQLAIHHLVTCIANRLRTEQSQDASKQNISEFIKTFNYIN